MLKLADIHKQQTSIFIFKYLSKLLPPFFYLTNYFTINKRIHKNNRGNHEQITIPFASTNTKLLIYILVPVYRIASHPHQ